MDKLKDIVKAHGFGTQVGFSQAIRLAKAVSDGAGLLGVVVGAVPQSVF